MTAQTAPGDTATKPAALLHTHQVGLFHPVALQELRGIVERALRTPEDAELLQFFGRHLIARERPEDAIRAYLEPRRFRHALDALRPLAASRYATAPDVVRVLELAQNVSCEPRLVGKRALDRVVTVSYQCGSVLKFADRVDVWIHLGGLVCTLRCAFEALDGCDYTERGVRAGIWDPSQDDLVNESLSDCTIPETQPLYVWGTRSHIIAGRDVFERSRAVSDERWRQLFGRFAREGLPTIVEGEELGPARRDVEFVREMAQEKPRWPDRPDGCARFDKDLGVLGEMVDRAAGEGLAVVEWVSVLQI